MVECGSGICRRDPSVRGWPGVDAMAAGFVLATIDEAGSRVGMVDVAWVVTRPLTQAISLSSNYYDVSTYTSAQEVACNHTRDIFRDASSSSLMLIEKLFV